MLDPLKPELPIVVSPMWSLRIEPRSSERVVTALKEWTTYLLSTPIYWAFKTRRIWLFQNVHNGASLKKKKKCVARWSCIHRNFRTWRQRYAEPSLEFRTGLHRKTLSWKKYHVVIIIITSKLNKEVYAYMTLTMQIWLALILMAHTTSNSSTWKVEAERLTIQG